MAVKVSYPDGTSKSYSSAAAAQKDMAARGYTTFNDKVSGGGAGTAVNASGGGGGADRYTSLIDRVDGGGKGQSGPQFEGGMLSNTLNNLGVRPVGSGGGLNLGGGGGGGGGGGDTRPVARPAILASGTGQDRQYIDTATGETFAQPGYSAFSWQGLTSSDPANVMRNRYAAQNMPLTPTDRDTGGDGGQPGGLTGLLSSAVQEIVQPPATSIDSGNQGEDDGLSGEEVSRRNAERSRVPTYEAGGYVGKGGVPQRPSTASLDLPPALARMLAMPTQSYAAGGMVGPGGVPQRPMTSPMAMNLAQQGGAPVVGVAPPGQQGRPLNFAAIDQQAQQFMQQHPQQVQQIRAQVEQAMASGEVDAQGLNMFVQIATTALQNPEMWPQLRQVLIRQGMLDAEEVGEEYDQGFLIVLYIIGKTMGGGQPTTPAPMSAGQSPQMSMKKGGALPAKSSNPDGSIPINAHEGEYVIPADVTRKLGTNHFDKLIAKARGVDMNGNGGSTSSMNDEGES